MIFDRRSSPPAQFFSQPPSQSDHFLQFLSISSHKPSSSDQIKIPQKMNPTIAVRPFEPTHSDANAIMSWASDDRVTRFQRRHSYTHTHEALHYLHTHILPHPFYRAILHNDTIVGSISITPCSDNGNKCRASIGYRLAYNYWGNGIATVVMRMAVSEVFERWEGVERVEGVVDVDNVGSMRVLEKAGFWREGVLRRYLVLKGEVRDVVMFSLVRADLLLG